MVDAQLSSLQTGAKSGDFPAGSDGLSDTEDR